MKVFLFSDYLKSIHGDPISDDKMICEIDHLDNLPEGLIRIGGKIARPCCVSVESESFYIEWVSTPVGNDKTYGCIEVTCPHCQNECSDSWEFCDEDEHECGACGTLFSSSRDVSVSYSSEIIERKESITDLK